MPSGPIYVVWITSDSREWWCADLARYHEIVLKIKRLINAK